MIEQDLLHKIGRNDSSVTSLTLTGLDDAGLLSLRQAMANGKNTYIKEIYIRTHHLTNNSYPNLLGLVKDHPSITSLQFDLIMPPSAGAGMCNAAISRILAQNEERVRTLVFHDVVKPPVTTDLLPNSNRSLKI